MAAVARETSSAPVPAAKAQPLRLLVMARLACGEGTTRAELVKDLAPLVGQRLSPAELRRAMDAGIAAMVGDAKATEVRYRISLSPAGLGEAHAALGLKTALKSQPLSWAEVRDVRLIAVALGIANEPASRIRSLARADGLQAAILQKAHGLSLKGGVTPARLRGALAVVALERAFGNKVRNGLGTGAGLSAKAGRLLASQLSARPKDFGTDRRLIAALAAESVGSAHGDPDSLRLALLQGLVAKVAAGQEQARARKEPPVATASPRQPPPAEAARPAAASRPDLQGFAREVQVAAGTRAEGWPGNRKAYISEVWQVLHERRPEWGLSEIEFKAMLAEAHRVGVVALANADLKDRRSLDRVQKSAVVFKNSVLHFVRVEE